MGNWILLQSEIVTEKRVKGFFMFKKNKNFIEAIKYLAERARIPLEIGKGESSQITKKRELLYKTKYKRH